MWRIYDGVLMRSFRGHVGAITDVCVSPDDLWLASSSTDGYDTHTHTHLWTLTLTLILHVLYVQVHKCVATGYIFICGTIGLC